MTALLLLLAASAHAMETIPYTHLKSKDACFILYDMKTGAEHLREGDARCKERMPACSTFKPALALAAFDAGVLKEDTTLAWDGKKHGISAWNRDHTPATWMKESVVWVSRETAPKVGRERLEGYLKDFGFGNADLSGGVDRAWLTVAPFLRTGARPTLKISVEEQVKFWARWWKGEVNVSASAVSLTKKITLLETSPGGWTLHGKTGSGFVGKDGTRRLGWFVGHLSGAGEEYVVVTTFVDKRERVKGWAGREAKGLTLKILADLGKW